MNPAQLTKLALASSLLAALATTAFFFGGQEQLDQARGTGQLRTLRTRVELSNSEAPPGQLTAYAPTSELSPARLYWELATQDASSSQGSSALEAVPVASSRSVELSLDAARSYAVSVVSPTQGAALVSVAPGQELPPKLTLPPKTHHLSLHLEDAEGRRVDYGALEIYSRLGHLVARTQATEGELDVQVASGVYLSRIVAPGYARDLQQILVLADEEKDIVLSRSHPLVVDFEGKRTGPVTVALVDTFGNLVDQKESDSKGAVTFSHVGPGSYTLWAGDGQHEVRKQVIQNGSSQDPSKQVLAWNEAEAQTRRVRLPQDCTPRVTAHFAGPAGMLSARTPRHQVEERDGATWVRLVLPPAETEVTVQCGDQVTTAEFFSRDPDRIVAKPSWRETVALSGKVLLPSDANTSLTEVFFSEEEARTVPVAGRVDHTGRYEIRVPVGSRGTLLARHPRYGAIKSEFSGDSSQNGLELRFEASQFVEGNVLDEEGQPVAGVTVAFTSPQGGNAFASSRDDGSFRVGPVSSSRGHLLPFSKGHVLAKQPTLVDARQHRPVQLVLRDP